MGALGTNENDIRDTIYEYLKRTGKYDPVTRTHQNYRRGTAFFPEYKGISDIITMQKGTGRFVAIEVKKPGGVLGVEQKKYLEAVHRSGGIALVAFSLDDVRDAGL